MKRLTDNELTVLENLADYVTLHSTVDSDAARQVARMASQAVAELRQRRVDEEPPVTALRRAYRDATERAEHNEKAFSALCHEHEVLRAAALQYLSMIDNHYGDDFLPAERRRPRMALDAALFRKTK